MRADPVEWGCSCGRLCMPEDDSCENCDSTRASGTPLPTLSARNRFLKKAERGDRRVLEGARGRLVEVETSYRETAGEFDRQCRAMNAGLEPWLDEDRSYTVDVFDSFYQDSDVEPWMWG